MKQTLFIVCCALLCYGSLAQQQNPATSSNPLLGEWLNNSDVLGNYVTASGQYAGDASVVANERYTFTADGRYENFYASTRNSQTHTYLYKGTYSISNGAVTLTPDYYEHKVNNRREANNNPNNMRQVILRYKFIKDDNKNVWALKFTGEDNLESDLLYRKPGGTTTPAAPATATNTNSKNVVINAPAGWTEKNVNGIRTFESPLLECTEYSYYTIYSFNTAKYDGSLQDFAALMHKSFFKPTGSFIYHDDGKRILKGTDDKGREYLQYETAAEDIALTNGDHQYHYYMVYLLRTGGNVLSFLLAEKPFSYSKGTRPMNENGFLYGCKPLANAWSNFLAGVQFSAAEPVTISANDITGKWASRMHTGWTGMVGGQYAVENTKVVDQFELSNNGTFTRSQATKMKVSGTYSIKGNQISFKESSGKSYGYTVQLQSLFEFGHWKRRIFLTDNSGNALELNEE